ncbi:class I ribonucleotide reductase maintenance protein YfaE [Candidatus Erwinia haradaeae]|uniref:Uncharacterized ferredoxin-like protein YfaE n=1 Tax=Candidatus Erwinia haradaeae TaxID=1922217 RepID=A0A451D3H6_9GAMM|nr:class I ribonucleotide reductase maintenance protein YfaE [Candidatus Erwinia haradaeae]VFP80217.1 Uncharacterized ferredoxin-like protein YfaE [Candidatus Erwinia haradaeae]
MQETIITLNPSGIKLIWCDLHHNLLTTLELHHIYSAYQCRAGYCGLCRIRLLRGLVKYRTQPLTFVRSGEILPCICHVCSNIEIAIPYQ